MALRYFNNVIKKRCIGFLLSDFMTRGYEAPLRIASRRHDLIAVSNDPIGYGARKQGHQSSRRRVVTKSWNIAKVRRIGPSEYRRELQDPVP